MRKLFWVLACIMMLAALGNLIGGTDTPVSASVAPVAGGSLPQAHMPEAPRFEATLFVSASSLNLRESPSTNGRVLASLKHNTKVQAGERRSGWVLVSAQGQLGWVSERYLSGVPTTPAISVPAQSQLPRYGLAQTQEAASCSARRYCTQVASCEEARWYLANCSWGHRLDGDGDGVPCESICR